MLQSFFPMQLTSDASVFAFRATMPWQIAWQYGTSAQVAFRQRR